MDHDTWKRLLKTGDYWVDRSVTRTAAEVEEAKARFDIDMWLETGRTDQFTR